MGERGIGTGEGTGGLERGRQLQAAHGTGMRTWGNERLGRRWEEGVEME